MFTTWEVELDPKYGRLQLGTRVRARRDPACVRREAVVVAPRRDTRFGAIRGVRRLREERRVVVWDTHVSIVLQREEHSRAQGGGRGVRWSMEEDTVKVIREVGVRKDSLPFSLWSRALRLPDSAKPTILTTLTKSRASLTVVARPWKRGVYRSMRREWDAAWRFERRGR